MKAHRERVERRRKASEVRATYRTTVLDAPASADSPGDAEKPTFTVTTVQAPAVSLESPVAEASEPAAAEEPDRSRGGRRAR